MDKTKLITEGQIDKKHKSRLITALDPIKSDITPFADNEQFGFKAILQTPTVYLENINLDNDNGFDMEFNIPFDDDMVANEAEFIVYNLSKSTANKFKVGNTIRMTAGYGKDTGIIFEGYISSVKNKQEGVDKQTIIKALDDVKYTPQMMEEKTYSANTKASDILNDLLNRLGLEVAVFKPQRDHIYKSETKIEGSIVDNIKEYSDVCGVSTYIHKQKIYCRPIMDGDNLHFDVSEKTGMIGSPEPFEEKNENEEYIDTVYGYNIEMLLQHRMATAGVVEMNSEYYAGLYRIVSGEHDYDGLSATTKIKCIHSFYTSIDNSKIEKDE